MIVSMSFFPSIILAKKNKPEEYLSKIQKLMDILSSIALVGSIVISLCSALIVKIIFGAQYNEAAMVLSIHIWASLFVFLGVASSKWYITEGLQLSLLYRAILGAIANIILNAILIPKYGINGAAIATLISYSMSDLFFDVINKKSRRIFNMKIESLTAVLRLKSLLKKS